jgi:hypothetical protein
MNLEISSTEILSILSNNYFLKRNGIFSVKMNNSIALDELGLSFMLVESEIKRIQKLCIFSQIKQFFVKNFSFFHKKLSDKNITISQKDNVRQNFLVHQ